MQDEVGRRETVEEASSLHTGCPGSSWQIAGGYLRLKTWIDF